MIADRAKAANLLPRFMNAVTTMSQSKERSIRLRLAWVVNDVLVFAPSQIPEEIKAKYEEFKQLVNEPKVPDYAINHPNYPKRIPAAYLSPKQAKRASDLLIEMFETIAYAGYSS